MEELIVERSKLDESVEIYRPNRRNEAIESSDFRPKRVAAYCRVSKNIEIQESSLETQIESFQRIIGERMDWQLVEIYHDKGISGTSAAKRPGFMRMIEDCKAGKIDYILAKSISRFARNTVDTLEYTRLLRSMGIGVYFEKERVDTTDLSSEMLLTVYAAFAQEESHSISENTRRGFRQKFQMGKAKYTKTFGYRCDKEDKDVWHIDESEAEVVKELFFRYLKGEKLHEICDDFNKRGIEAPNGDVWYRCSASKILTNEKYVGDVTMQKTVVVDLLNHISKKNDGIVPMYKKKDHHPAIVSREDFNIVQRMLKLKNVMHGSHQYPYYDYLRCPKCGGQMVQFMTALPRNQAGWICCNHNSCQEHFILTKYLDRAVKEAIMELPDCLTGYEEAIMDAKEHLAGSNDIELYCLTKLVDKIELDGNYTEIRIRFKFGKEAVTKLKFDRPSEYPNPIVEYRDNELYINDVHYTELAGKRVCDAINRNRSYTKSLLIKKPMEIDGIYRADNRTNGMSNWMRKKDEDNNDKARGEAKKEEGGGILPRVDLQGRAGGLLRLPGRLLHPIDKE